jgi:hypothetical protein
MYMQLLTCIRGIEFQYRPHNPPNNRHRSPSGYPLTFDQRITQGDRYREAAEVLDAKLQSIEQFYASPESGSHTGSQDCERCTIKTRRIMRAFHEYYLGNQPGRWDEGLLTYRQELEDMFNNPSVTLEAIHKRFQAELSQHLIQDLGAVLPGGQGDAVEYEFDFERIFGEVPLETTLEMGLQAKTNVLASEPGLDGRVGNNVLQDPTHPAGFNVSLNNAKTAEQRAELYIAYYCTPVWNDTPQQRNMKAKYSKLFESGESHDAVLQMWRKEAQDIKSRELDRLKQRLGELQMAQSAHLKNKARKIEKDARMKDKEYVVVPRLVECSLPNCEVQMDVSKQGPIQCAVCDWLSRRSGDRRHFYYCSEDHVEKDFVSHSSILLSSRVSELIAGRMSMTDTSMLALWVITAITL